MRNVFTRFAKKEDGVAAIEFAILAPVFFALMSAIFEISYFIYANTAVQRAMEDVIYDIRTGYVYKLTAEEQSLLPKDWYEREICNRVSIPGCSSSIQVKIQQFDQNYDIFSDTSDQGTFNYGVAQTLMRVEASVLAPNIALTGAIFGEENLRIVAGLTFMTEPY